MRHFVRFELFGNIEQLKGGVMFGNQRDKSLRVERIRE